MRWNGPNPARSLLMAGLLVLLFSLPTRTVSGGATSNNQLLAILQTEDPVPADAVALHVLTLQGEDYGGDCAYYELLLRAEQMATEAGANLLHVRKRIKHSRAQHCDGLEVAFYRTAEPRRAEQSFRWDASRPLTWDDFQGNVRAGSAERTAAETNCGIAVETNLVTSGGKARVYVFNTFDKRSSWVRRGQELPAVLEHEQGHWDICELYTRKMQARFDATEITGANLNQKVNEIYNAVNEEYIQRQEQYERDTRHGVVPEEQQRWTRLLAKELATDMTSRW